MFSARGPVSHWRAVVRFEDRGKPHGVVGFQLGGPSIRGERRVPASPTVDSQTSKMKGGELSLEQVRVLPPRAAPRPHPWIRRFDKFAPLVDKFDGEMTTL